MNMGVSFPRRYNNPNICEPNIINIKMIFKMNIKIDRGNIELKEEINKCNVLVQDFNTPCQLFINQTGRKSVRI